MRAYLIDATIRTITEFDYIDEFHEPAEILGGDGRGNFTLGSGPLDPPVLDDSADGFAADYTYVRDHGLEQWREGDPTPEDRGEITGDPRFWFQIDAGRKRPTSPLIPGRGLVIGVREEGSWTDARISLAELIARVTFSRRKLRGTTTSATILTGEVWSVPVAPVIEER